MIQHFWDFTCRVSATWIMVKVGDFAVELVAEPFKEHTASNNNGQVYAEVEPDMDYFISLRSDVGGVIMRMSVDGVDLGYDQPFHHPSTAYSWYTITALHFNKAREEVGALSNMLTGKVEVKVR